ncbi:MAG: NAD(P)-dependent oxidoreductase [Candidatus Competibacteraceae bacterium]|nr:NAD(P)-dependent oxidoreductase [Candidatus Competibacteraceae bacterium]
MLESSHAAGVKAFLFVSSAAAILLSTAANGRGYVPRGPCRRLLPAGWMKRYAELLCRTYALKVNPSMATVVVRPSNVYGPGDKFDLGASPT